MEIVTKLWKPHKYQQVIRKDKHRFKVISCGRRFGKTTLAINVLIERALQTPNGLFWYISPTYRQSKAIAWRMLVSQYYNLPPTLRGDKNESELWVEINNAKIVLKGADSEDSLRGSGLDGLVIDEVASINNFKSLWEEVLRPDLTDKKGWAWMISTPKGFNFFYEYWLKGQPGQQKEDEYQSWQVISHDHS